MTTIKQSNEFPKRVMLVIHSLQGGGSERQMSYLANEIATQSETCLVTIDAVGNDGYPLDSRIGRIGLNRTASQGGFFRGLLANMQRIRALRDRIRDWNPEVVVSFCDSTNVLTLCACPASTPVLISERSDPRRQMLSLPWQLIRKRSYPRAKICVAQTREVGDYLAQQEWVDPSRIRIIPSAIQIPELDLQLLDAKRRSQSRKILVYVGRLSQEKRLDRLLDAWSRLAAKHADWQLRIVGDGAERGSLQSLAGRLDILHSVDWVPWTRDVWSELGSANAFCLVSDYEGFPQSMLEAMASGLPVAVLDCSPAIRQTIVDGENGLIIPTENCVQEVIDGLLSNERLQWDLGRNAAKRAGDFEWSAIAPLWRNAIAAARG